jgi:hypothetical protein
MIYNCRFTVSAIVLLICCSSAGLAAAAGRPTCALIVDSKDDLNRSPLLGVLETTLADAAQVRLVERAKLASVLKEQELATLLQPEAVGQRVKLGQVVHADLLAVLRSTNKPAPAIKIVVCQTSTGLRLLSDGISPSNDPSADAAKIAAIVAKAVAKHGEGVTDIIAVPPFVDLTFGPQAQHLKGGYARLLEEQIQRRPGMRVVELKEAQAVASEITAGKLGNGPGGIARRLPLYLIGEYRQEGTGQDGRITASLVLKRGTQELGKWKQANLTESDSVAAVRGAADQMLEKVAGKSPAKADIATEARQLADRSRAFAKLGEWEEAFSLAEASLLLKPDQVDLHRDAAAAALTYADLAAPVRTPDGERRQRELEANAELLRRGLPHLEAFMLRTVISAKRDQIIFIYQKPQIRPELAAMFLRVLDYKRLNKVKDETVNFTERLPETCSRTDTKDTWMTDYAYESIQRYQDPPIVPLDRTIVFIVRWGAPGVRNNKGPAVADVAKKLSGFKNEMSKQCAATIQRRLAAGLMATMDTPIENAINIPPKPLINSDHPDLKVTPLTINDNPNNAGIDNPNIGETYGWIAAGKGIDAVWARPNDSRDKDRFAYKLLVTKGRGRFTEVTDIIAEATQSPIGFDGRYIYAMAREGAVNEPNNRARDKDREKAAGHTPPHLLIVDTQAERVFHFQMTKEVPQEPLIYFSCVVLAPGKLLVVGTFGRDASNCRSWVAIVTLDGKDLAASHVTLILEASHLPDDATKANHWKDPQAAFRCTSLSVITGEGKTAGQTRVVVGRTLLGAPPVNGNQPMLVDPDTGKVEVMQEKFPLSYQTVHKGTIWGIDARTDKPVLYSFGFPDLKVHKDDRVVPLPRSMCFAGDSIVILPIREQAIYVSDGPGQAFRRLAVNLPTWPDLIFSSQNDGLVLRHNQVYLSAISDMAKSDSRGGK